MILTAPSRGNSVTKILCSPLTPAAHKVAGFDMSDKRLRIVLKFGSGILASARGNSLDEGQFKRLAAEVAALVQTGHECVLVSSAAVAAGMRSLGLKERPTELSTSQACAAIGQSKLMQLYATVFAGHGLDVAQLLLTHGDLDSRTRNRNARNTLERLLACKNVVPIINENDSVAVEELRFGDNDRLSAEVAMLAQADLLILLTSVDGLMDDKGERVPNVTDVESVAKFVRQEKGKLSVGGMASKLEAVRLATHAGISAVIASGRRAGVIRSIAAGKPTGTRFVAHAEISAAGKARRR
ncbi:MAG: glutamate 5-kinase [Chthoniobacter sp.]|jgi:glutamate 5-kinase|nr:glutamate 5-kinase [Chthoniobacter sp.]